MRFLGITLDWGGLIAILVTLGTVFFFLVGIMVAEANQSIRLDDVSSDVATLKLDAKKLSNSLEDIDRSLGRIEGYLRFNENKR